MVRIRHETADDIEAIRDVNVRAFRGPDEALLVDRLRADGKAIVSLVADDDGRIVGHILFSRVFIESKGDNTPAVSLAPMGVVPERQRQGIGSNLVREGPKQCRDKGERIALVVGHPEYYPRFGFSYALTANLHNRYADGAAFMAAELARGALDAVTGEVRYSAAFDMAG